MIRDNFQFKRIWNKQSLAALILCWMPTSDDTAMPFVTCMDWSCRWYNHAKDVVPCSTGLAFVTKMSEKYKSPSAIQVKNWRKTICT